MVEREIRRSNGLYLMIAEFLHDIGTREDQRKVDNRKKSAMHGSGGSSGGGGPFGRMRSEGQYEDRWNSGDSQQQQQQQQRLTFDMRREFSDDNLPATSLTQLSSLNRDTSLTQRSDDTSPDLPPRNPAPASDSSGGRGLGLGLNPNPNRGRGRASTKSSFQTKIIFSSFVFWKDFILLWGSIFSF